MSRKIRSYESDAIVVDYDVKRCIHAEECVRGLPAVFDPDRRPWADPEGASATEVAEVVERCPTGALHYRRMDGGEEERAPEGNTVRVRPDGPLYLSGRLRMMLPTGETLHETRAALCRCGHSKDRPFCDNSHQSAGFRDSGMILENRLKPADDQEAATLEISVAKNGPILVRGPVEVKPAGGVSALGGAGALCRCGRSASKPFCDGSHAAAGFEAD